MVYIMVKEHEFNARIYYPHTDAGGVVYHGQYLAFADMARTEWLRSFHVNLSDVYENERILVMVKDIKVTYHKPARLDDVISVMTSVETIGGASAVLKQRICISNNGIVGDELATLKIVLVAVKDDVGAVKWPHEIRNAFTQFTNA